MIPDDYIFRPQAKKKWARGTVRGNRAWQKDCQGGRMETRVTASVRSLAQLPVTGTTKIWAYTGQKVMQNTWRWANWGWPVDPTVMRDRAYWGLCSPLGGCGSLLVSKMAPTAPAFRSGLEVLLSSSAPFLGHMMTLREEN